MKDGNWALRQVQGNVTTAVPAGRGTAGCELITEEQLTSINSRGSRATPTWAIVALGHYFGGGHQQWKTINLTVPVPNVSTYYMVIYLHSGCRALLDGTDQRIVV